jgi:hypothetical protein
MPLTSQAWFALNLLQIQRLKCMLGKLLSATILFRVEGLIAFDKYVSNFWFFGYLLDK